MAKSIPIPVVSALLEKEVDGELAIFVQTRFKPKVSPQFSGLIEIPAGGIESYEHVLAALRREVHEETGLNIIEILDNPEETFSENIVGNKTTVFKPFLCQQALTTLGGLPWIGFVFRCRVEGKVKMDESETKDPRWLKVSELKEELFTHPKSFFPLQYPVLLYYVDQVGDSFSLS